MSACKPSHIQQQEITLNTAIQKRDLIAQYEALVILAGHDSANWSTQLAQVKDNLIKLENAKSLFIENKPINAYKVLHEIKKGYNYQQVNQ
ncbi:hypothetical protein [Pseudoalteromonas citrea]|uniref:Uncharacterized protein n=1 Tax=Pseudoalteromonas citrea DSM 8771 TaxID=1117314 RepID=U1KX96_9GAMM|nr:hypothetical protein [Pseudoalteromonas citrea]